MMLGQLLVIATKLPQTFGTRFWEGTKALALDPGHGWGPTQ